MSEMKQHTRGPWTTRRTHLMSDDCWYVVVDPDGRGPIMDVGCNVTKGQIAEAKYLVTDPEIIEANARLIAAAPDLLLAYQEFLAIYLDSDMSPEDDCHSLAGLMRAAVDKAIGDQS